MPKRLLIADDSSALRRVIRSALESQADLEVCGEAADGIEAIEKATELRPDLVILDFSMPRIHGLEPGKRLKELVPAVPLVLFTMHKGAVRESELAQAGIQAVVSKTDGIDALIRQVQLLLTSTHHIAIPLRFCRASVTPNKTPTKIEN